jgi:hypothetical protein
MGMTVLYLGWAVLYPGWTVLYLCLTVRAGLLSWAVPGLCGYLYIIIYTKIHICIYLKTKAIEQPIPSYSSMDQSTGLQQVFSEAGMQDKEGLQIGLTEGQ